MNEHERPGDPAFDRLVAADPARRAPGPVEGVLRAKVDGLVAGADPARDGASGAGTADAGSGAHERVDQVAARRSRRRAPWLVAAAVAGIVAAGGGGYLLGESGLGAGPVAADAGPAAEDADVPSPLKASEESVPEGVRPLDAGGDLPAVARTVFHAGAGLSEAPRTAQVRTAGASGGESWGAYPVVSEVEAVERLGDPRFAGAVLGARLPVPDGAEAGGAAPAPGGPIAWPVEDVTIVSATLTETRYTLPDGTVLLVPAYDLADAAGSEWTVMAVDEEQLDLTP